MKSVQTESWACALALAPRSPWVELPSLCDVHQLQRAGACLGTTSCALAGSRDEGSPWSSGRSYSTDHGKRNSFHLRGLALHSLFFYQHMHVAHPPPALVCLFREAVGKWLGCGLKVGGNPCIHTNICQAGGSCSLYISKLLLSHFFEQLNNKKKIPFHCARWCSEQHRVLMADFNNKDNRGLKGAVQEAGKHIPFPRGCT